MSASNTINTSGGKPKTGFDPDNQAILNATTHSTALKKEMEPQIRAGRVLKIPKAGKLLKINNSIEATQHQKEETATTDQN